MVHDVFDTFAIHSGFVFDIPDSDTDSMAKKWQHRQSCFHDTEM